MEQSHILNELGILTSFSVAKKITDEEVHAFFREQKKAGLSDEKISEMLHRKVVEDIDNALKNNEIPGLIHSSEFFKRANGTKNIQDIAEINRLILIISTKLAEKSYNKTTLCYFINALVNILQLDEKAFEDFHKEDEDDENDGGDDDTLI